MSSREYLDIRPTELKFPFELKKRSSCSLQLTNKTDEYVAFKMQSTYPIKYGACPNKEIIIPGAKCVVTVTMAAQKEAPEDMQCEDLFLIQSVIAPRGATGKDITPEMFDKERVKVEEFILNTIYVPVNPPVLGGSSSGASAVENGSQEISLSDDEVSRHT
ncbi:hypothetical protein MKW92_010382 [Papaver armeniacum]|nr:hypothetical protein MKW92_010382 [Papaver armeniacum]